MAAKVDIFNAALTSIGADEVTNPDTDDSAGAKACRARYDAVRDATLRAHPWNCAESLASLPADATAPAWGYARAFTLPADCLRVLALEDAAAVWKVRGRKIHSDEAAPLKITYVARVEDTQQYDALLVEAMAARLAAAIAYRLANSSKIRDAAWKVYFEKLREARAVDGQEGRGPEPDSDFIDSRI